ncbi:hypothetical protein FHL15_001756 [Xylaria flabelliformis]|uniref:Uncharacterized protein n=1 Tax=Xylaria flabelliformis TaxID=2512241 RepID=A0A553IBA4_9PEZI|nr:hypothetical protein FHL15_001756 [Xylaria flabelliformis]
MLSLELTLLLATSGTDPDAGSKAGSHGSSQDNAAPGTQLTANVEYLPPAPFTSCRVTDSTITSHDLEDKDRIRFHGLVV